ncbi:hypothetical protein HNQ44_002840 [Planomicrobium koreense]|uniref:Uncharacterized protein n=1 Tax=Planococcus koreensis TaxID=112331 RepID=A0A7W8FV86_9BACL|nr:hypothetical protein [Planococcus koreensis]MBB5181375.1 hypothetical protein [Planococcus koreensis]
MDKKREEEETVEPVGTEGIEEVEEETEEETKNDDSYFDKIYSNVASNRYENLRTSYIENKAKALRKKHK